MLPDDVPNSKAAAEVRRYGAGNLFTARGAQGLKGPPVCIIMNGSANANVTVALLQNSSWLITPLGNQNDFLETESWNKAVSFVKQLPVQASWPSSRTG